jgi:multidrug resistance efflux pump
MKLTPKLIGRAILPVVALGLIGFAVVTIDGRDDAIAAPPAPPATAPAGAGSVVAALGIVEPSSEVIAVGSELPGVVREVFVTPGELVAAGAPLFRLDGRAITASLDASMAGAQQARASAAAAVSRIPTLEASARGAAAGIGLAEAGVQTALGNLEQARGRLGTARAAAEAARIAAADAASRFALFETLSDPRAVSTDERDRARFASDQARAAAAQAEAGVREAEGGVRSAEGGLADARARLAQAQASAAGARAAVTEARDSASASRAGADQAAAQSRVVATDLERLIVRAPIAGQVLRLNVRVGEFAPAGPLAEPLVAMGQVDPLHVRVQIDEEDAPRVLAGAMAEASLRGDASRKIRLAFVRFEPQATPKTNLSGGAERVDTRVIEAVYSFQRGDLPVFVGQQMDVFVQARPFGGESAAAATTRQEQGK